MILRHRIIETFRTIFERHGFEPIDTPALEYGEVLTGKAGENEKMMYRFEDNGGRNVGLRYDLTVPLARYVSVHESETVFPFKRYHIAPVWRAEKPQRGRGREFWQCDADIVGTASMAADAEVISIAAEALTAVGLPNFVIHISHRRLLEALALSAGVGSEHACNVFRAIDKLAKIGANGVRQELIESGVDSDAADRLLKAVTVSGSNDAILADIADRLGGTSEAEGAVKELSELFGLLQDFGVPESSYRFDVSLARGLDYYTGPVFEALVEEPKIGSVVGAGRYDGLVGAFLGRPIAATGMSLGLERIIEVVREHGLMPLPAPIAEVALVVFPETVGAGARLASSLREQGLRVDLSLQPHRGIGDQLKLADRKGIPVAVILGSSELEAGVATLKDLRDGHQSAVALDDLAEVVHGLLEQPIPVGGRSSSAVS